MSGRAPVDPSRHVHLPLARALDSVILVAAASFAVFVLATVAAVLTPTGPLHELAHVSLLIVMAVVVIARGVHVLRRRGRPPENSWQRAAAIHRGDVLVARTLTAAVPLIWLVGNLTILAHHLPVVERAWPVIGIWLPLGAALWILASFAWHDFCHDRIGAALDESDRRFRGYWRDIGRS